TNVDLGIVFLQSSFQFRKRLEAWLFELGNPALVDFLQRDWVEEMQLFATATYAGDEVRRLEHVEVLRHTLARYVEVIAELVQRLAVVGMQDVEQLASARIGQGLEKCVIVAA